MPRANQTDWISRGVPLEKTVSAAMGYINSFLVPFAVDFTGLAQLLAKSARSHFRWRIICRGSENASTHHPIHLSGVSGKTIPYDANIVTGFVHSMPVVKQKRLWLGFQRPAKAANVLCSKLVFDHPDNAYSAKHSK